MVSRSAADDSLRQPLSYEARDLRKMRVSRVGHLGQRSKNKKNGVQDGVQSRPYGHQPSNPSVATYWSAIQ